MPRTVEYDGGYNAPLFKALLHLISTWPELSEEGDTSRSRLTKVADGLAWSPQASASATRSEQLAYLIAHQSLLATRIETTAVNQGKNATDRKKDVSRLVSTLRKARKIWAQMENDDQKSLSGCLEDLKLSPEAGHEFLEGLPYDVVLRGFEPSYPIATWRREELSKHQSWGLDVEMLDLLITNADAWLKTKAPPSQHRHDPVLYAVQYIASACEAFGIKASASDNSRFTKIITLYFNYTYPDRQNAMFPRDMINKANQLRKADPYDSLEPPDLNEQ